MTLLQAHAISIFLPQGDTLFSGLHLALHREVTAVVGRNGSGKSVLAAVLSGQRQPDEGTVVAAGRVGFLPQMADFQERQSLGTVADALGVAACLNAMARIEAGSCDPADFEAVNDQWELPEQLSHQLAMLGLPDDLWQRCLSLSGGELSRLRLWRCFQQEADLLILDEPSNHLDAEGRQWLMHQITQFRGGIFLISHDQQLLSLANCIYEMSHQGLVCYGGDFSDYRSQKQREAEALAHDVARAKQQVASLARQHQRNEEKAQKRAAAGQRDRHHGSQSKLLLDYQKNSAESAGSARKQQQSQQMARAKTEFQTLQAKMDPAKPLRFTTEDVQKRQARLLTLTELRLQYGRFDPISRCVWFGDKIHLQGNNGIGKSTLLKTLLGALPAQSGEILRHSPLCYLDQHFSLFEPNETVLDNLHRLCPSYTVAELRTRAACIGFRGERATQQMGSLSGGERMRLAMLVVSHQDQEGTLLLDEPDNHLDLEGKLMMAQALRLYRGSFILVSHDPGFVSDCGVNQHWSFNV
ncbi:ATP-binding cassette domain-containing protein [Photobacterium sp. 1_MG-2023]|uniref:ATP-binding cassette domain-containing protein n=1 Tax=Photobacterium sp. 1_MG-2023 TaxID=3062646 RepID=UPI0026E1882D|nr:ATP-binding cassette domain-containing protein [Photobacterium sp. 1_MG-2023]MDO6706185.1 ATP-binding cassette domain-containing protein [Photobacterium sp. 1_MG-2023]